MELFLILAVIILSSIIAYMNFTFKKMQELHMHKIEKLHLVILELSKNQKKQGQKLHLADDFKSQYASSKLVLNNEILGLQKEILFILQKNDLIE